MDIAIQKKAQSFRLPVDLIERLKKMARKQNRSLNNFVECALLDLVYSEPDEETNMTQKALRENEILKGITQSIKEAKSGNTLPLDTLREQL